MRVIVPTVRLVDSMYFVLPPTIDSNTSPPPLMTLILAELCPLISETMLFAARLATLDHSVHPDTSKYSGVFFYEP